VYFFLGGGVMALGRSVYSGEVRRRITGKCGQLCGEVGAYLGDV